MLLPDVSHPELGVRGKASRLQVAEVVTVNADDGTIDARPLTSRATKIHVRYPTWWMPRTGERCLLAYDAGDERTPICLGYFGPADGSLVGPQLRATIAATSLPDASATDKGVSRLSAAPAAPTDPIAVGTNDTRIPTQNENDALAGTSGAPSSANKYVTDADARNTNARAPSGAAGGVLSGTYPNPGFAADMATQAELDAVIAAAVFDGDVALGDLAGFYPGPSLSATITRGATTLITGFGTTGDTVMRAALYSDGHWEYGAGGASSRDVWMGRTATGVYTIKGAVGAFTLAVQQGPSQGTSDLQQWLDASGNVTTFVNVNGALAIRAAGGGAVVANWDASGYYRGSGLTNVANTGSFIDVGQLLTNAVAIRARVTNVITAFTRAVALQTADLHQWQASGGSSAVLSAIEILGTYRTNIAASGAVVRNFLVQTDANPAYVDLGSGARQFGAGGASAVDTMLKRETSGLLVVRDAADTAYMAFKASALTAVTTLLPPQKTSSGAIAGELFYDNVAGRVKYRDGTADRTVMYDGEAAGGDLSGTYPNPAIADRAVKNTQVSSTQGALTFDAGGAGLTFPAGGGLTFSGTAAAGTALTSDGAGGAYWAAAAALLAGVGVGGDLAGTLPNPTVLGVTGLDWPSTPGWKYATLLGGFVLLWNATGSPGQALILRSNFNPQTDRMIDTSKPSWSITLNSVSDIARIQRAAPTTGALSVQTVLGLASDGEVTLMKPINRFGTLASRPSTAPSGTTYLCSDLIFDAAGAGLTFPSSGGLGFGLTDGDTYLSDGAGWTRTVKGAANL